ncbi:DUF155-domain-containing protein [Patellaria atrata CBS 101060]|uniref:DUF155-domain-containing protein n=1 Tax=Patellaria atrata CBS 101060 TaxID=1346257 RepID=A0A9P4VPK0_9PEZI|nr:DUF155-domain-containing protein [Patellaria atrata CBS 101060]
MASASTSASASEATPLISSMHKHSSSPPPTRRTVTFNPYVLSSSPNRSSYLPFTNQNGASGASTGLSALNSKLLRRNSVGGAPSSTLPPLPKIGPQRTTRTAQKLKLLPSPEYGDDGPEEDSGRDVYAQFTRIKDPTSRRDAARLGKEDRARLPRVTAYCTASSYRMDDLMRYLKGKAKTRASAPKLFDECIYTPYRYPKTDKDKNAQLTAEIHAHAHARPQDSLGLMLQPERRYSDSALEETHLEHRKNSMIDMHNQAGDISLDTGEGSIIPRSPDGVRRMSDSVPDSLDFDTEVHIPEIFVFDYGVCVLWGLTLQQEQRFLKEIAKFEIEKLAKDDVQTEDFNFYYTREYQARIYNDFISLKEKKNYMTKLAISHALAQSVKTSLYEDLVSNTIEVTKEIPSQIAVTGKVNLTRREINMQIGELFILRINIHLQGSVLDAPELMWSEPQLEPVYSAVRKYLEMDQRVTLLTERLDVIADLLSVLKDQLTHSHVSIPLLHSL